MSDLAPLGVDAETGEIVAPDDVRLAWQPMNEAQAKKVTADINLYATRLCMLVKDAKDGRAWEALGYKSWSEYVDTELDVSRSRAYQLLDQAELAALASVLAVLPVSTIVDTLPEGKTRGIGTEQLREALMAALESLGPNPTEADRMAAVEATIETLRGEVRQAKKLAAEANAKIPAPEAEAPAPSAPVPDQTSEERLDAAMKRLSEDATSDDAAPPSGAPSDEQEGRSADAPPATSDPVDPAPGDGDQVDGGGGSGQPAAQPPVVVQPSPETGASGEPEPLPDDWAKRIGDATYLLSIGAPSIAAHASDDDFADLTALRDLIDNALAIKEQNA